MGNEGPVYAAGMTKDSCLWWWLVVGEGRGGERDSVEAALVVVRVCGVGPGGANFYVGFCCPFRPFYRGGIYFNY